MSRFLIVLILADLLALVYLMTILAASLQKPLPPGWYLVGPAA